MRIDITLNNKLIRNWVTRKTPPNDCKKCSNNSLRIVDLFCGCGGLTSGIVEASREFGLFPDIALAIDNNQSALAVYRDNFGKYAKLVDNCDINDVFKYRPKLNSLKKDIVLQKKFGSIDVLVAGPPCQGNSDLNNRTRRNDPRNNLYLSTIEAVRILLPKLVLIENVPAVVHSKQNVVIKTIKDLTRLKYFTKEIKVHFTKLGLPQTRKRHVIVASLNKKFIDAISFDDCDDAEPSLIDFISDLENAVDNDSILLKPGKSTNINVKRIKYLFANNLFDLPDSQRPDCHKNKQHSYTSNYGRLSYNKPSQTITSGFGSIGQGRYIHPTRQRTITAREAARIQGFPDDFKFESVQSVSELRQMIANAVPPQLSYSIIINYLKMIKKIA